MKNIRRFVIFASEDPAQPIMCVIALILLVGALFNLPACTHTQQATAATQITTGAAAVTSTVQGLPPELVAKVKALASKYPTATKYADATAKALNVAATTLDKLPTPNQLKGYLFWTAFDPKLDAYASDFEAIYTEFFPALTHSTAALSQIAAVVQTSH